MATFDIYVRISAEGDRSPAEVAEQLDLYEATCREWAERNGIEVGEVARESNVSGAAKIDERELGHLIRRVEAGESAGILTPYLDRFGRDTVEGCLAYRRIKQASGRLVCVSDGIDSDRPGDETIFQVRMVFAEDYLRRVNANFQARIDRAAAAGAYLAGWPPVGYDRDAEGRITPNAKAKPLVREAFRRRAEGVTAEAIRDYLREKGNGIETRDERKPEGKKALRPFDNISKGGVRHMLANRAYLGESRVRTERKGEPRTILNAHPPIVTEDEWERARAAGGLYHPRNGRWASRSRLRGLVQCPNGHRMKVGASGRRPGPEPARAAYICTHETCNARAAILAEPLDEFIAGLLQMAVVTDVPEVIAVLAGDDRYQRALTAVEAARTELDAYIETVKVSDVGRDSWIRGKEARQAALDAARAELRATPAPTPFRKAARGRAMTFEEALPGLERDEFARFVDRVVVRPVGRGKRVPFYERLEVYWVGAEDPADLSLAIPTEEVLYEVAA